MSSAVQDYFPQRKMKETWERVFGRSGTTLYWTSAPGRVNLIGEHTDYHGGLVLPCAIDLKTYLLAAPREDSKVRCHSINLDVTLEFDLNGLKPGDVSGWGRYVAGSAWALLEEGHAIQGVDAVVWGTVPFGGGLSSSASIEVAWIVLWNMMESLKLSPRRVAELGKKAENGYVGVPCGIMDQFASSACREGHALFLDCLTLNTQDVSIPADWRIVVCDTGVRHELASSEYGKRQVECREGLMAVKKRHPNAQLLRDVSFEMLKEARADMSELSYRRCYYVLEENDRVRECIRALNDNDEKDVGRFMAESHAGLRDAYEVSCPELDRAVVIANTLEGLVGARMTGGGFGGCTVNLVKVSHAETFRTELENRYREEMGGKGHVLLLSPGSGAKGGTLDA